jgi:CMP/dCMP kinase
VIIAIDGPAGAGKSTVSLAVAEALGFQLVNTGSLYRAVALVSSERGVALSDGAGLAEVARGLSPRFVVEEGVPRLYLSERDVTDALRTASCSDRASLVSAVPEVRSALYALQRELGATSDVVMEGRDIGTAIFPDADVKVYLTASVGERATRRYAEQVAAGDSTPLSAVQAAIEERDRRDRERPTAPLRQAADAVVVDATGRSVSEVVSAVLSLVRARAGVVEPVGAGPRG